ncbi:M16 family metallopeptidase [Thermodesulfobacteriota bacterium]
MKDHLKYFLSMIVKSSIFMLFYLLFLNTLFSTNAEAVTITEGAQRFKLNNGLNVILKEDHSAPVASIQVWIKTGSANESEEVAGITHLIEHMIFKGTPTRKTGEIARSIEASGGKINAYTSFDRTVYFAEIAASHFDTALDVLLDAIQNSLFDPSELEREREVVLEEYRRSLDLPQRRLNWAIFDLSYKKHPYRRPIIGYETSIRSIDRDDILNYMNRWYTPENMVLVAVGDFNTPDALKTIRTFTKNFPDRSGQTPARPMEPIQTSPRSKIITADVQQIYMDISWHIPSLSHPHIPALNLLEIILGQGKSSRLYTRLKMEENLVRSVSSEAYSMADPGLFSVESTLSRDSMSSALEAIAGQITRITKEQVLESELSRAKRIAESGYLSEMESMKGQTGTLAFFETMAGDMNRADEYLEQLKAVTAADIVNAARIYLRPDNLSICLIAPEGSNIELSADRITKIFSQTSGRGSNEREPKKEDKGITKVDFPNGMRVIIKENHRLPLVSIRAVFLGGTRLERPEHSGISEFTAKMLTRGTLKRSASEIASTVESWGGKLEGFSGRNSSGISAKFLSRDLYPGLDLLADLILNPSFPKVEMDKVKEDILSDIKAKKDSPMEQLSDLFNKTLYRNHPYGRSSTGTTESISSINVSDLMEWHKSLVLSSNLVLAVVGDVYKDEFIGKVGELFKDLDSSPFDPPKILPEPSMQKEREVHLKRPGNQVHILIGYLGADLKSSDNVIMALIDTALSGQGGRLFMELRDKQSLAYSVSSFRRPGLETGMFGAYLACDPEKLPTAKEAIFREFERLKREGLTQQELEDAKRYILGNMAIKHQTNGSQALRMALDELYGLGYDHSQIFIKEIEKVTLEDIQRAAKGIFLPKGYTVATVGPVS